MKCPTCLSTMKCITEIHDIPGQPGRQRMDLHCYNRNKKDPQSGNFCRARCHMSVITEDPKEWICIGYGFEFSFNNYPYWLSSFDHPVDHYQHHEMGTTLTNTSGKVLLSFPYFYPLSTGDDMHEKAWELFYRLKKLIVYS